MPDDDVRFARGFELAEAAEKIAAAGGATEIIGGGAA